MLKNEQTVSILTELINKAAFGGGVQQTQVRKGASYINKTAARILFEVGKADSARTSWGQTVSEAFKSAYGIELSKAASDYTGDNVEFAGTMDFRRYGLLDESNAKEWWNFVYNYADPFIKEITLKTGKKQPEPIDMWGMIEENLISSTRSGSQPGTGLKKQVAKFGKELLARHIEMQHDLRYEDIINNIEDPGFEDKVINTIMIGYANDILRIWTNGTSYDYTSVTLSDTYDRDDMYKLCKGWIYKLQTGNGTFTNSNQNEQILGPFGKELTAVKYALPGTGTITKYSQAFASGVDSFVAQEDCTVSNDSGTLKILKGSTTASGCYAQRTGIEVKKNINTTVKMDLTGSGATASMYFEVLSNDQSTVLAKSAIQTGDTSEHELSVTFFSGENQFVVLRIHQTTDSVYANVDDILVTQEIADYSGDDIIDFMNALHDMRPLKYRSNKYAYIMSYEDVDKYADAKGSPIKKHFTGSYYSVNNTMREQWVVSGEIPMHKGHRVLVNPFMHSISEAKSYGGTSLYGSIIFGDPKELFGYGLVGNFPTQPLSTKKFEPRSASGGAAVEVTNHAWTDAEVAPNGRFCIAFYGAQCETPVLATSDDPKPAYVTSGTSTAATGVYAYCDTPGARIFATLTANVADIATIELAIAGVAAGDVYELTEGTVFDDDAGLTAAAWSFAAFKDGKLLRSDVKACTFA